MYAIQTRNITKEYNNQTVVNNIDLVVNQGSVFGFLGKNGAGKSTFINMLTGLTNATSGTFTLLSGNNGNIQHQIGVLPDYSTLYDDLSALDHLNYFNKVMGLKKKKSELIQILNDVGLKKHANTKTKKFSFGMKKKLGVAQAILNNPKLLFLDEPTSGVDANSALELHELIKKIAQQGATVFLTSHNLYEIEKLCDEIAIMKSGEIVIQGTLEELKNKYRSAINVTFKHSDIPRHSEINIKKQLSSIGQLDFSSKNLTKLVVDSESEVSLVNKTFIAFDVDVFEISIYSPSLEDIFLNI